MAKRGAKGRKRGAPASKVQKEDPVSDVEEDEQVRDVEDASDEERPARQEENDSEEDAPPPKRGRPSKGKAKEAEEEEEDSAPVKNGRPSKGKAKGKSPAKGKAKGKGKGKATPKSKKPAAPEEEDDSDKEYEVDRILDMRETKKGRLFQVKWEGYSADEATWEPESNLSDCSAKVDAFMKKLEQRKNVTEKDLRTDRKQTKPYQDSVRNQGVRASRRFAAKPRTTYHGLDA